MGEINYNDCNFHAFSPLLHLVLESNSIVPLIAGCMVGNKQSPSAIAITCQFMSENKIHPIKIRLGPLTVVIMAATQNEMFVKLL